jgi:hypothetical protein
MNTALEASQLSDNCPIPLWKFYFPNQGNLYISSVYSLTFSAPLIRMEFIKSDWN